MNTDDEFEHLSLIVVFFRCVQMRLYHKGAPKKKILWKNLWSPASANNLHYK